MYYIGIDIGSTASKVAVYDESKNDFIELFMIPTGWSGVEAANRILSMLEEKNINKTNSYFVGTGYGRVSIEYADKTLTEITCHARGANFLFDNLNGTLIDIGGQDTKIIKIKNSKVENFMMNDKCSAGTGRFIELMANSLGCSIPILIEEAQKCTKTDIVISSMCTVFAETEIISLKASGKQKSEIAYAIINSVANKVASLCGKFKDDTYFLTGGLSNFDYLIKALEKTLGGKVITNKDGQYAGAIGAAIIGLEKNSNNNDTEKTNEKNDNTATDNKQKVLIITFNTTTDVMRAEKTFKNIMTENSRTLGKIVSTPNEISAGCGLSWESEIDLKDYLINILNENEIEYDKSYEINKI